MLEIFSILNEKVCLNNGNVVGDGCLNVDGTRMIFGLGKEEDEYMNAENKGGSDFLIERKMYFLELFKYRNCSNRTNKHKIPVSKFH